MSNALRKSTVYIRAEYKMADFRTCVELALLADLFNRSEGGVAFLPD